MCSNPTNPRDYIYCGRCGRVVNPNDRWENDWPNYGYVVLGYNSVINWPLCDGANPSNTGDHRKHPAVIKDLTGYQQVAIAWNKPTGDAGATWDNQNYRLCTDCQSAFITVVGQFFKMRSDGPQQPIWRDEIANEQIQTSHHLWSLPRGYTVGPHENGYAVFLCTDVVSCGESPLEAMYAAHGPISEKSLEAMKARYAAAESTRQIAGEGKKPG